MKGQLKYLSVQEAATMGIASDTCSHISGLAGLPQHSFLQHRDWIQTHSEIQKLQILEFIEYHVIINWWNCSVLQGVVAQKLTCTLLIVSLHKLHMHIITSSSLWHMNDQHFARQKCKRVTLPSGLQHFYSLAACSLQFLPHTHTRTPRSTEHPRKLPSRLTSHVHTTWMGP